MARGWESKAVEAQQDEASRAQAPALTADERAVAERRATLELTRARAAADLIRASALPHRRMLEQAIATIDEQLAQLPASPTL